MSEDAKQAEPAARVALPGIGRMVHYFDTERPHEFNSMGKGPYAAIVIQVWGEDKPTLDVGLKVITPAGDFTLRLIGHKTLAEQRKEHRYWVWPGRT